MGIEKYQPSESEAKNAERSMTEEDRARTQMRENYLNFLRARGEHLGFTIDTERITWNGLEGCIEGSIKGHKVEFYLKNPEGGRPDDPDIFVSIDGANIDDKKIKYDLYQKYGASLIRDIKFISSIEDPDSVKGGEQIRDRIDENWKKAMDVAQELLK